VRGAASRPWRRFRNTVQLVGLDRVAGPDVETKTFAAGGSPAAVPVVLCVWRRPERLAKTVKLLAQQRDATVELHVWNNNRRAVDEVESVLAAAPFAASVTHSSRNVGGFGRFYLARHLAASRPFVVFVDDDVTFGETMARDFAGEWSARTISSFWGFRLLNADDFWARTPGRPGEPVDYCGTGGMVADTGIFREQGLFRCPRRFWFVEDLWLSYYASHVLGWELRKSAVELQLVEEDGNDQYLHLARRKSRFLRQLVREGWSMPSLSANSGASG
jgi:hypothetical protein